MKNLKFDFINRLINAIWFFYRNFIIVQGSGKKIN